MTQREAVIQTLERLGEIATLGTLKSISIFRNLPMHLVHHVAHFLAYFVATFQSRFLFPHAPQSSFCRKKGSLKGFL